MFRHLITPGFLQRSASADSGEIETIFTSELHRRSLQAAVWVASTTTPIFLVFQHRNAPCFRRGSITNLRFCPPRLPFTQLHQGTF